MPTPGSKVCSASGWPMPRMNTLTLLDEPRPWTMLRFGTAPCRPPMSPAWRSLSCSSPNAVTATGTSWIDSERRRAVTSTAPRVLVSAACCAAWAGLMASAGSVAGAASCAQAAAGNIRTQPMARLKCLRFIPSCLPLDGGKRRRPGEGAAPYLRTMGRAAPGPGHCRPRFCPSWREGPIRMDFVIVLAALCFLMYVAYRGHSVILFAPVAALGAVLLTDPSLVAPMFTGLFMDKMVGFLKLYFPVFLLGAVFGKVIELSGFS